MIRPTDELLIQRIHICSKMAAPVSLDLERTLPACSSFGTSRDISRRYI